MKKAMPWIWTEAQTKALETLKTLMCSKPVLTQPQYDKPFIVHTNASAYGMGTICWKLSPFAGLENSFRLIGNFDHESSSLSLSPSHYDWTSFLPCKINTSPFTLLGLWHL